MRQNAIFIRNMEGQEKKRKKERQVREADGDRKGKESEG